MKLFYRWASLLGTCLVLLSHAFAQGVVWFANKAPSVGVDARVTLADGTMERLFRIGCTAQLYAGPAYHHLCVRHSRGLHPPSRCSRPGGRFGQTATLQMRVFDGQTWSDSLCRGESNLMVKLGVQTQPGPYLVGLQPFQVVCIPEPSTLALLSGGLALLFLKKRMPYWTLTRLSVQKLVIMVNHNP